MPHFLDLPVRTLVERLTRREVSVETVVQGYLERIQSADPLVHAWQHVDAERALNEARERDKELPGPLYGLPIGVKDLIDTADMPTTYGSLRYAGHRPSLDAVCVATAREAGAVVLGKTVTTEFATFQPGPTKNPRASADQPRTPGGSSSGSAAAVAAGMAPLAFGTQTAGSIIRPAAYCGVIGYKPTYGTLSVAGIKALSPSLDTLGVLARHVDDAAFFVGRLARLELDPQPLGRLRIGVCRQPHAIEASTDSIRAVETAARMLENQGAQLHDIVLPEACEGLTAAQIDIMGYEAAAAFAPELKTSPDGFSDAFRAFLSAGAQVSDARYTAAQSLARQARISLHHLFDQVDLIVAPSAPDIAPVGLAATGDPIFNRLWTLLGNPCVHVPTGIGECGMPTGATLIGPCRSDVLVLSAAHALESALA
ncbi:amidase [Candidimonas sp. SYP-B2681]|uniref:amidase n=1 Tax=Candidimonas sp. SYP-B2681 TaxID=2497686 RepID=UPI000F878127|nr:amidase [Candidimonas sp. SYP-B2681]RTZ45555.1 amidase [Candidimonas sp. SYP-B2681]